MLDTSPLELKKSWWRHEEGFFVAKHLVSLNGRPRSQAKGSQELKHITNISFILNEGEEGVIGKLSINQLRQGL